MAFSMWRERRDVYRVLVGNPGGKNLLEDDGRWEGIKVDLQEVGWWGID